MCLSKSCKKVYNFIIDRLAKGDSTQKSNESEISEPTSRKFENRETLNSFKNLYNAVPISTRIPTEEDLPTGRSFDQMMTLGDSFSIQRLSPEESAKLFQKILNLQAERILTIESQKQVTADKDSNSDGSISDESKVIRKMEKFYESKFKTHRDKISISFVENYLQSTKREKFYYTGYLVNDSKEGYGTLRKFFRGKKFRP